MSGFSSPPNGRDARLSPVRIDRPTAQEFIRLHHRHHDPNLWWHFGCGAWDGTRLVGVAVVGIPSARNISSDYVAEVTRLCTDGAANACSFLYARCADVATALGFQAIITYTLDAESGASLRALGWWGERGAVDGGKSWDGPARTRLGRRGKEIGLSKTRWLKLLGDFGAQPQFAPEPVDANLSLPLAVAQ